MEKKYFDELVRLVSIPSVFDEHAVDGGPFGKNVKDVLEEALSFAEKEGYKAKNYDGYAGEFDIGSGEDYIIGILGHLDVVPVDSAWETDPFDPVLKGTRLYGRGTCDDKGPIMASLAAAARLEQEGKIPDGTKIRFILGTNEEELWKGIDYYLKKVERLPDVSLVPDGSFPLVYCEKGLYDHDVFFPFVPGGEDASSAPYELIGLTGGTSRSLVPASCTAKIRTFDASAKDKVAAFTAEAGYDAECAYDDGILSIVVHGTSVHAMNPEKGINAISRMIHTLDACFGSAGSHGAFTAAYMEKFGLTCNGERCGVALEDEDSGKLTLNIGEIELLEDGTVKLYGNLRFPTSFTKEAVLAAYKESLQEAGFTMEDYDYLRPVHFDRNGELVTTLLRVYQEVTGDLASQPIAMGGATYARAIPNAVNYGPVFPDEPELAHEPNEYVDLESLDKAEEIYYRALEELIRKKEIFRKN
ncbi:MAG: Sapep family Mn(2+)-dependent dipeptidase [Anaerovoracaceae bacterium]|jgi:succinyl-diaminopimelate desuccinylase